MSLDPRLALFVGAVLLAGCADQTLDRAPPPGAASPASDPVDDPGVAPAAPTAPAPDAGADASPPSSICATTLGSAVTSVFGRLDGTVRAVIAPGDTRCRSDNDHVIVQIDTPDATYAAWINVQSSLAIADPDVRIAEIRAPLALGAWSGGWHAAPGALDYATTLGVHTGASFTAMTKSALAAYIAARVTPGARVSVFFEGFATGDGGHKVHRNGAGNDGALVVLEPAGSPRWLLFHFSEQVF